MPRPVVQVVKSELTRAAAKVKVNGLSQTRGRRASGLDGHQGWRGPGVGRAARRAARRTWAQGSTARSGVQRWGSHAQEPVHWGEDDAYPQDPATGGDISLEKKEGPGTSGRVSF